MNSQVLAPSSQAPSEPSMLAAAASERNVQHTRRHVPESDSNLVVWAAIALATSLAASLVLAIAAVRLFRKGRRAAARNSARFSNLEVDGQHAPRLEEGAIVCAQLRFAPELQEGASAGTCLALEPGDVLKVIADSGDGWLFGHILGAPDQGGFFPEALVSWVGSPLAAEPPGASPGAVAADLTSANPVQVPVGRPEVPDLDTLSSQGFIATVKQAFRPEEVEDEAFARGCLAISEGEVVRVSAGSDGWFYGQVVGMPERVGYFPEDRTSWLSTPSPQGVTAETP